VDAAHLEAFSNQVSRKIVPDLTYPLITQHVPWRFHIIVPGVLMTVESEPMVPSASVGLFDRRKPADICRLQEVRQATRYVDRLNFVQQTKLLDLKKGGQLGFILFNKLSNFNFFSLLWLSYGNSLDQVLSGWNHMHVPACMEQRSFEDTPISQTRRTSLLSGT
jgi:hypothetical protein